jgi:hypothetical protein
MKRAIILMASVLLALAACDDKKADTKPEDPTAKNTTTNATATATATAAQPVAIDEADLATPADFEEAAATSITKANYKTELTTLEADIAKPD